MRKISQDKPSNIDRRKNRSLERLIHDFESWMQEALEKHIAEGWSLATFASMHGISQAAWYYDLNKHKKIAPIIEKFKKENKKVNL